MAIGYTYDPYKENEQIAGIRSQIEQNNLNKPGEYQSKWGQQLNDTMNQIMNRKEFSYDLNGDALWNQYKDNYTTQGKMAMQNAMGQAAAMTGGYGNSYAQQVGQQTFQGYMQNLNDKIPELYNLALSTYQARGNDLANRYNMLNAAENQDYGRYQDALGNWQNERSYLDNLYNNERNLDYSRWSDQYNRDYANWLDAREQAQQQVEKMQKKGKTGQVSADLLAAAGYDQSYIDAFFAKKKGGGGGGSSGGTGSAGGNDSSSNGSSVVGTFYNGTANDRKGHVYSDLVNPDKDRRGTK